MTTTSPGQKMHVGVVFGGRSVEHKVSVVSARTVAAALDEAGYGVVPLGIAQDGCWVERGASERALSGEVDALSPVGGRPAASLRHLLEAPLDAVFPIVHGTWGEDGTLQGLFETLDLPYVGTGVASSAVCMDKALAKQVLSANSVPVVDYELVTRRQMADSEAVLERIRRLPLPIFVKPCVGGSSVGVVKVTAWEDLHSALDFALRFDDRLVVEQGIDGRELECAVLGYGELRASGIGEIVPGKDFYDYADKYLEDGAQLIHRADLPAERSEELRALAIRAFEATDGWGMARVDFLLGDAGLFVNEINTLPGFTAISMYPKLWEAEGLPPAALVDRLVEAALRRHRDRRRLDEGIKGWITELAGG
ncbi:MAG: D-alanine--D-alanine ligase family protein [Acidobacteriota bacterium]